MSKVSKEGGEDSSGPVAALHRLADTLHELNVHTENNNDNNKSKHQPSFVMTHYRNLPEEVQDAYKLIEDGAAHVKATSTKFTLVSKFDQKEGSKLSHDLLRGAELISTGVFVLCNDSLGCGMSCRTYAKKASRAIVATLLNLLESTESDGGSSDDNASAHKNNLEAQKTGAVWSACDEILNKRIPRGNCASMRRDLFQWIRDCEDTYKEFAEMLTSGVMNDNAENHNDTEKDTNDDSLWDDFCCEEDNQYSARDYPIAKACLPLLKCSRGTLHCILHAIQNPSSSNTATTLFHIQTLHAMARAVGEGATELGALLYPPLDINNNALEDRVRLQATTMSDLLTYLVREDVYVADMLNVPDDMMQLARKLRTAAPKRLEEALTYIHIA